MKKTHWATGLLFAALLLAAAPAAAQTTQPAKPATVKDVLAYAPGPVMGVVHVDVATIRPTIKKLLPLLPQDTPTETKKLDALLPKIQSIDLFIQGLDPKLLIRGTATAAEVIEVFGEDHPFNTSDWAEKLWNEAKGKNELKEVAKTVTKKDGLYNVRDEYGLLWGDESKFLPKGYMLIGFKPQRAQNILPGLGKVSKTNKSLAELLKSVDTSRPIWGGAIIPNLVPEKENPPQIPRTIIGSANLTGKNEAIDAKIVLGDEETAQKLAAEFEKELKVFGLGSLSIKAVGKSILIGTTGESQTPLADQFIAAFQKGARQAASQKNLLTFGAAFALYGNANNDQFPKELGVLIDKGFLKPQALICPLNPKAEEFKAYNRKNFKTYEGQKFKCDLIVIKPRKDFDDWDIHAYYNPVFYEDKNGDIDSIDVLRICGAVTSMKYDDFKKRLMEQTKK